MFSLCSLFVVDVNDLFWCPEKNLRRNAPDFTLFKTNGIAVSLRWAARALFASQTNASHVGYNGTTRLCRSLSWWLCSHPFDSSPTKCILRYCGHKKRSIVVIKAASYSGFLIVTPPKFQSWCEQRNSRPLGPRGKLYIQKLNWCEGRTRFSAVPNCSFGFQGWRDAVLRRQLPRD